MTILFHYFSGSGGGFANIMLLLQVFATRYRNDRITIVCDEKSALTRLAVLENVEVITIPIRFHPELSRFELGYFGLRRYVCEMNPDVLWSVNLGSYRELGIPQVMMVNNLYQVDAWSHVARLHPRGPIFLGFLRFFFRKSLHKCSTVIVQTELMKRRVLNVTGCPAYVHVVSKAVETAEDYSFSHLPDKLRAMLERNTGPAVFTYLYVADESTHKNHKVLVSAINRMRFSNLPIRLALTLSANDVVRVAGMPAKSQMESGHLLALGWVEKEYLQAVYKACDVCVIPSLLESQSSAHLEAMQWGKPLISANLPYATHLCGDASLYADPNDPEQWAERMTELLLNAKTRTKLVHAARRQMDKYPKNWAEVAQRIHSILEKSVAGYEKTKQVV